MHSDVSTHKMNSDHDDKSGTSFTRTWSHSCLAGARSRYHL